MRQPPRLTMPIRKQSELPPKNVYEQETAHLPVVEPVDHRPKLIKPLEQVLTPRYNQLYDTLRSTQGWKYVSDGLAHGTISTSVNGTVTTPVTLSNVPQWRLEQWPGAVQVYLAIRFFGIVPQSIPTANAGMEILYIDQSGITAPLGEFLAATGGNSSYDTIIPNPVTDPGNTGVGTLSISLANVANSNATYYWSIGFSAIYLLPARYGYERLDQEEYENIHRHGH